MNFKEASGIKVAITKDKNNNDWDTKGTKISFGNKIPTNKLFEKSGVGNIRNPPTSPIIIEIYALFSLMVLL